MSPQVISKMDATGLWSSQLQPTNIQPSHTEDEVVSRLGLLTLTNVVGLIHFDAWLLLALFEFHAKDRNTRKIQLTS